MDKLQAVIAARQELDAPPHFKPSGTQTVIFIKELKLVDVNQLVPVTYDYPNWVADTKVWFVVFKGDIQITVPGQSSPSSTLHGCSYVIIGEEGGYGDEVGGFDCAKVIELKSK